ncbi:hypothetical protein [Streptomyces parvus]|uniref:hypothetical protein n=1 Tax=Streptomyces parvus TaxID=66428 RepID=UPI0037231738
MLKERLSRSITVVTTENDSIINGALESRPSGGNAIVVPVGEVVLVRMTSETGSHPRGPGVHPPAEICGQAPRLPRGSTTPWSEWGLRSVYEPCGEGVSMRTKDRMIRQFVREEFGPEAGFIEQ